MVAAGGTDVPAFRLAAPGVQCPVVLGAGPAYRIALRRLVAARPDAVIRSDLQYRAMVVRRAGALWRLVGGALRLAGLLLAVSDAGAKRAFRSAPGRGGDDARLAGAVPVRCGNHARLRRHCQCGPCWRTDHRLPVRRDRRRPAAHALTRYNARLMNHAPENP